ncbi:MAG: hypothetical protein COX70_02520 [Flavobacteriales bacterium CG_4_10_14_0_2_um_filter_32_8]|nr:MAG: hypothetical protein COX70_02520 [Flavobacteriales bacterium CG_4_10_14_0_2_um_filter_32_8]
MHYKFFSKHILVSVIFFAILVDAKAQLIDSVALDTFPTYTLSSALNQDPLKVYKLSLKKMKLTELPIEIFAFKNLQVLDISKNKFTIFPKDIAKFTYLQELNISINKIEIITKELGDLIYLQRLIANQNKIVSIPPEIKNLKNLKFIDLWSNDIGSFPYEIGELENSLEEIDMRVILMSDEEHQKIKELLPHTKIRFSKSCSCGF